MLVDDFDQAGRCAIFVLSVLFYLPTVAGLGLEPVDEVDDVVEASSGAIADTASRDGDG